MGDDKTVSIQTAKMLLRKYQDVSFALRDVLSIAEAFGYHTIVNKVRADPKLAEWLDIWRTEQEGAELIRESEDAQ